MASRSLLDTYNWWYLLLWWCFDQLHLDFDSSPLRPRVGWCCYCIAPPLTIVLQSYRSHRLFGRDLFERHLPCYRPSQQSRGTSQLLFDHTG